MKVYAIIECHYDAYFPNHIVLDGSAYLHEEDAEKAFKERQASQGGHILVMRPFNVIDRPKTSVTRDLKPCPCCGSEARMHYGRSHFYARCENQACLLSTRRFQTPEMTAE